MEEAPSASPDAEIAGGPYPARTMANGKRRKARPRRDGDQRQPPKRPGANGKPRKDKPDMVYAGGPEPAGTRSEGKTQRGQGKLANPEEANQNETRGKRPNPDGHKPITDPRRGKRNPEETETKTQPAIANPVESEGPPEEAPATSQTAKAKSTLPDRVSNKGIQNRS